MAAICRSRSKADGSRRLQRARSTVPVLQREGHTRFALTAGEYRSGNSQQETPDFSGTCCRQAGRSTAAPSWQTAIAPLTLGWGKHGLFRRPVAGYHSGQRHRLTTANIRGSRCVFYNKSDETGTNLQLVGYRYSTRGYYNFADTTYRRMSGYSVETGRRYP